MNKKQIEFLDLLRDYLIRHGTIKKRDLISTPFTLVQSDGIRGVFSVEEIDEILKITKELVA